MDNHEDVELAALVKAQAAYHEAPQSLRDRIGVALDRVEPAKAAPRTHGWTGWRQWLGLGVVFACGMMLSVAITFLYGVPGQQDRLAAQVIDGHVRSLMVAHLSDVASSDQHTVKPWFNGKLDFSPPVWDLAAEGFPLVGGRLDYIDERSVAALVYRHQLHTINVFIWPARSNPSLASSAASRQGFNVTSWSDDGMQFWAVSDLNSSDLQRFGQLLRKQRKS
jgi:anti-sigma factor RsiW